VYGQTGEPPRGAPSSNWADVPTDEWRAAVERASRAAVERASRAAGVDVPVGGTREPVVAVNPLDPLNVAMSSLFSYRVSINGGATWGTARSNTVPAGYGQDGDPSMAFDHQGRLFYSYQGFHTASGGADEFVCELNPATGVRISGPVMVTTSGAGGNYNDKDWLAVDRFAASPFAGRLYLVWSEFPISGSVRVLTSFSVDHGLTWSAPLLLSVASEGFPWPAHVAVAPNGDVYVSYHAQPGFIGSNPDGVSGRVYVLRSTNGGVSFPQKTLAYAAGQADVTYNVQTSPGTIPGTNFWLQGSGQAWVLPDPHVPGSVYVVANDDPDNAHGSGDDANVYIARSTNHGASWSAPLRVDHGPGTSFQVMPTAWMDDVTGCIAVLWYDNRAGALNANFNYLLDVYYTISDDRGLTFGPDVKINDAFFNPELGAPNRYNGPPPTKRIGEYIGVTMGDGNLYAVWCGNTLSGQQIITDSAPGACRDCNANQMPDSQDILQGVSLNCNLNAIPDECEYPGCSGILLADLNCDGQRNGGDLQDFVNRLVSGDYTCQADVNQDGAVNSLDVSPFTAVVLSP
jgi:hypothetical protein